LYRVAIIGGGISGLSAAYFLEKEAAQAGIEIAIDLFEARRRLGGVIVTEQRGEFLVEGGPESFLAVKTAAADLCRELGIGDQLLPSNDALRKTFVLQGGRLRELPEGLMFVVPSRVWPLFASDLLSWNAKLRLVTSPLRPAPKMQSPGEDVSVAEFIRRRFGSEVLERLAEPLLAAVYGADVDMLSARAALPQLIALEEKYGSLWKGLRAAASNDPKQPGQSRPKGSLFITLQGGVGQLIEALQDRLRRTTVHTETTAARVGRSADGPGIGIAMESSAGEAIADALIVATPAHAAAQLLRELDCGLAEQLARIRYHSSLIVAFGFDRTAFRTPPQGFGFVVPRNEGRRVVALTWVSTKFDFRSSADQLLVRCFLGGARDPRAAELTDDQLVAVSLRELNEICGESVQPSFHCVYRWSLSMPEYGLGHLELLRAIERRLAGQPGLFLAGNGYRGVGIPDCIQSGGAAAAAAVRHLRMLGAR
jgi:oxygen-dependent protoporphyrinogen oxidase